MYDGCLIDFGLKFKGFRLHFGVKFRFERALAGTLRLFWAYFGIMEGHWRGVGEPDAGKSLSKRREHGGAPPFWAEKWVCDPPVSSPKSRQRPPKSNKSCEKKQSSTNWKTLCVWKWIFGKFGCQNHASFRQDSKIKVSFVRRYRRYKNMKKPSVFLMILRVRSVGRMKKTSWKNHKNLT